MATILNADNILGGATVTGDASGSLALQGAGNTGITISSTGVATLSDGNQIGYLNIPQNSQSGAYTLVLADAGKHIFHPVGDNNARTFTIPANSSVAYPIGTAITFMASVGG